MTMSRERGPNSPRTKPERVSLEQRAQYINTRAEGLIGRMKAALSGDQHDFSSAGIHLFGNPQLGHGIHITIASSFADLGNATSIGFGDVIQGGRATGEIELTVYKPTVSTVSPEHGFEVNDDIQTRFEFKDGKVDAREITHGWVPAPAVIPVELWDIGAGPDDEHFDDELPMSAERYAIVEQALDTVDKALTSLPLEANAA